MDQINRGVVKCGEKLIGLKDDSSSYRESVDDIFSKGLNGSNTNFII